MSTREPQEDRKTPPKPTPRTTKPDDDRDAREPSGADPFADDNPEICRGID
jgi:hypothetical protein